MTKFIFLKDSKSNLRASGAWLLQRKKMRHQIPIFLLVVLFFCSCNGKLSDGNSHFFDKNEDIYIAGDENNIATYWKNGEAVHLTDLNNFSHASGIAVVGNDVYVSGYKTNHKDAVYESGSSQDTVVVDSKNTVPQQNGTIAGYWKNKKFVNVSDGTVNAEASSIAVVGKDVYVAGYECDGQKAAPGSDDLNNAVAKYWKNGQPVVLTDGVNVAKATSVAVKDSDVYVVGYEQLGQNQSKELRYWKNGKRINVKIDKNIGHGSDYSEAYSVFVLGNDVYIAGTESGLATYWKNGNPVKLIDPVKSQPGQVDNMIVSKASSIVVNGTDVYVAGTQDTLASMNTVGKYWKNGKPFSLTHAPEDLKSNVYVALSGKNACLVYSLADKSDKRTARIWKHGLTKILSDKVTEVNALVIVKHL